MKYFSFLLFLIITSCTTVPDDFAIKMDLGDDSYNSKTGIFIREYNFKKNAHVKIILTDEEKSELYNFYKKENFLSFPSEFECDTLKPGRIIPSSSIIIEITADGIVKGSRTSSYCTEKIEMDKEKKLYQLEHMLYNMIKKRQAYKNIPETDRMYL